MTLTLLLNGAQQKYAIANLSGSGAFPLTATRSLPGALELAATSSLTAAALPARTASATFAGVGGFTASGTLTVAASASFTGTANLDSSTGREGFLACQLAAVAGFGTTGTVTARAVLQLAAETTVDVAALAIHLAAGDFSGASSVTAAAVRAAPAGAAFAGQAAFGSSPTTTSYPVLGLVGVSVLEGHAFRETTITADLLAAAELHAPANVTYFVAATFTAEGVWESVAVRAVLAELGLTATSTWQATGRAFTTATMVAGSVAAQWFAGVNRHNWSVGSVKR